MRHFAVVFALVGVGALQADEQSSLLIHRIGPSKSVIYVARADGSQERPLLTSPALATTRQSRRTDNGSRSLLNATAADIYRVRLDGSSQERLTEHAAYDDQAAWSPDGKSIAFVSTRDSGSADIWALDLATKASRKITASAGGDFRPSWSPDGQSIAFTSDGGSRIERDAPEWEHLQRNSIFVIRSNGQDLRRVTDGQRFAGSPRWSAEWQSTRPL